jgi:dipeptidyl aminopeptidase/acylaminoacyl peptidase
MATLSSRAATIPRTPLRAAAILALLLLALAAGAALLIGSRHQAPTPFGPAVNGHVAFAAAGDIFTVDPVTGTATAIVTGPETDINPRWSRDGTHLAFERKVAGDSGPGLVYFARGDGTNPVRVKTPSPLADIESYDFSPDGTELLIVYGNDYPQILIVATEGGAFRDLGLGTAAVGAAWRPPDGAEILFMGVETEGADGCCAIQAVNATTGEVRTILGVEPGRYRGHPRWSPDGTMISFAEWGPGDPDNGGLTVQTHIIAADGTWERPLAGPPGTDWQAPESWSNDGTRLLVIRGDSGTSEGARPVAIPVDGHGSGVEIDWPSAMLSPTDPLAWEWAPDDSSILGTPFENDVYLEQVLLDPVAGTSRTLPWTSDSLPSWQRIAP